MQPTLSQREGARAPGLPHLQIQEVIHLLELYQMSQTEGNKNNFYICDKKTSKRKPGIYICQDLQRPWAVTTFNPARSLLPTDSFF